MLLPFQIGDEVELSDLARKSFKDSKINPHFLCGKVVGSGQTPIPYTVMWDNGTVNGYYRSELRPKGVIKVAEYCVACFTREDKFIKGEPNLILEEVMHHVRRFQKDPAIPYVVIFKGKSEQVRAWWRLEKHPGLWLKAGRLDPEQDREELKHGLILKNN